jgi:GH15 family glucan-1,4-alpha-glucosidase
MARIEDYALIGDCQSAALVSRDGSIDWLCLPRFDSPACFAALLGDASNGLWRIAPEERYDVTRRYRKETLVLETTFATSSGRVTLVDAMPIREHHPHVVRFVVGERGSVRMRTQIILRFDYGSMIPWVRRADDGIRAIAGPDRVSIHTPVLLRGKDFTTVGEFTVNAGDRVPFVLDWHPSYVSEPRRLDPDVALSGAEDFWLVWSQRCTTKGPYRDAVVRSLITLKALTHARTGGILAAPTTSLPERIGGERNWDYRYCWLRDATFTLYALMHAGYLDEARAWREWLLRAAAGAPSKLQILYAVDGSRRLDELEVPWLPGYERSRPVRIGNAAAEQVQLDVYGELIDTLHQCYRSGLEPEEAAWPLQRALVEFLAKTWTEPDAGIWEVRGRPRRFTHSQVMAWCAVDRAIKSAQRSCFAAPLERWRALRETIHAETCARGFDSKRNSFVQAYGESHLDASLLRLPLVGFLPASDPRVQGTVAAIERELLHDGLVRRYHTSTDVDGLSHGEGLFLPCSFWLCDNYLLAGRHHEARALYERLLDLRNDVGLLSEEYDPVARRLVGNFPQAFSHVAVVVTALNLTHEECPATHRGRS